MKVAIVYTQYLLLGCTQKFAGRRGGIFCMGWKFQGDKFQGGNFTLRERDFAIILIRNSFYLPYFPFGYLILHVKMFWRNFPVT